MAMQLLIKRYGDAPDAPPLDRQSFTGPIITIGSDAATASLVLRGAGIAAEHVVIINEDGHMLLINRAEGTALNEELLAREGRRPLVHGDNLRIGDYLITFVFPSAYESVQIARQIETPRTPAPQSREALLDATEPKTSKTSIAPPRTAAISGNGEEQAQSNFASILDSLRTEEDSFYFLIEGGLHNQRRVTIGSAEMPLGWDQTGQILAFDAGTVTTLRAIVRKDWSGVIVQTQSAGTVAVNGEPVESTRRLHNGDRLMLVPTANTAAQNQSFLIFHEPASLVVLDSLLPQKLPPPVPLQSPEEMAATLGQTTTSPPPTKTAIARADKATTAPAKKVFGYFSRTEILIMLTGTLFMATIVFLLLEYL